MSASNDLTLWTSKLVALVCSVAAAIYAGVGLEPSPIVELILVGCPLFAVILWLQKDAQRTRTGAILDWGLFLWIAWPAVIPWYAWSTRGRAGWRLALGLIGLVLAPYLTGVGVAWLAYGVRYRLWRYGVGD
jgi:hypothetical protein